MLSRGSIWRLVLGLDAALIANVPRLQMGLILRQCLCCTRYSLRAPHLLAQLEPTLLASGGAINSSSARYPRICVLVRPVRVFRPSIAVLTVPNFVLSARWLSLWHYIRIPALGNPPDDAC